MNPLARRGEKDLHAVTRPICLPFIYTYMPICKHTDKKCETHLRCIALKSESLPPNVSFFQSKLKIHYSITLLPYGIQYKLTCSKLLSISMPSSDSLKLQLQLSLRTLVTPKHYKNLLYEATMLLIAFCLSQPTF